MGGRGRVSPTGGAREGALAAQARRRFQRGLSRAVGAAENVPSMEVIPRRAGGTSPTTAMVADARVAEAAGLSSGTIGRVVAQPDGRFRAEFAGGGRPRYFRSGAAAQEHLVNELRTRVEARVGGAVPLTRTVPRGGAAAVRAAGREAQAVAMARRERIPLSEARRLVSGRR